MNKEVKQIEKILSDKNITDKFRKELEEKKEILLNKKTINK